MFHINTNQGDLLVVGDPDAETKDFYNLTIQVSDGFNTAQTNVGPTSLFLKPHFISLYDKSKSTFVLVVNDRLGSVYCRFSVVYSFPELS